MNTHDYEYVRSVHSRTRTTPTETNAGTLTDAAVKEEPEDYYPPEEYDPLLLGPAESKDAKAVSVKEELPPKESLVRFCTDPMVRLVRLKDSKDLDMRHLFQTTLIALPMNTMGDETTADIKIKDEPLDPLELLAVADHTPISVQRPEVGRVKSENIIPEIKNESIDLENLVEEPFNEDDAILRFANCWELVTNPRYEKDETATIRVKLESNDQITESFFKQLNSSGLPRSNDFIHTDKILHGTPTEKINRERKLLECHHCQKTFLRKLYLLKHILIHTVEYLLECDICHKAFPLKSNLRQHMKTHIGDKSHKCHICRMTFLQKSHFNRHIQTHTGDKPHKCYTCRKAFLRRSDMKTHLRTHTGEKPYKCQICHMAFSMKSHLKSHMQIHTGEKPHKCHICHAAFSLKSILNRHMRTHTGEKPHKCHICRRAFSRKSHLDRHMPQKHSN